MTTNDAVATQGRSRIWLWLIGIGGVALGAVIVVAVVVGFYLVTAPDTPRQAATNYIEDHYDALAEEAAYAILPDSPLLAEVVAEVVESIAERVIPFRCRAPEAGDLDEVEARCTLSFEADEPFAIAIVAPFLVSVDLSISDAFGRPIPEVTDADLIITEVEVNGFSLQKMLQAGDDILTQIGAAEDAIKGIRDAGDDVIKQVGDAGSDAIEQIEDAADTIKQVGDAGSDAIEQIGDAADTIKQVGDSGSDAIKQIGAGDSDDGNDDDDDDNDQEQDDDSGNRLQNLLNR